MLYYIVMCKSLTYAQRTARILERVGIITSVMRAPQALGAAGCAYCVKVPERRLDEAVRLLSTSGLMPGKIFSMNPDGTYSEVLV